MAPSNGPFPLGDRCGDCHTTGFDGAHEQSASYLTQNLTDDHPISMNYPTPAQDPDFNIPAQVTGVGGLRLFGAGDTVECASCHNVHDPAVVPFLRKSNAGSALCKTCHIK
jgi:predicted CXXCH cytochrome family protein